MCVLLLLLPPVRPYTECSVQPMNFTTTYLNSVLNFFDFETEIFPIKGSTTTPEFLPKTMSEALKKIQAAPR